MESIKGTAVSKHVVTLSRHKGPEDDRPPLQPNVALFSAQIIAKAGMKTWSLHDLRRTVATRLSELGAPPHVVEKLLGHHRAGVMARYNLHDYIDDQRHWLAVWRNHLERLIGIIWCDAYFSLPFQEVWQSPALRASIYSRLRKWLRKIGWHPGGGTPKIPCASRNFVP